MTDAGGGARPAFVPIPEARLRSGLGAWGLSDARLAPLPRGAQGEVFRVEDRSGRRWLAKYAYMDRHDFEPGLLAAEVVSAGAMRAATPNRTSSGQLVAMVEWPDGVAHPLALLTWIAGQPLDPTTPAAAPAIGRTLGRVQTLLLDAGRERLGLSTERDYLGYLRSTTQDLGDHDWLHARNAALVGEVDELAATGTLTCGPGVWDGPEIVVDRDGAFGLIDFGNVDWHPVAHVAAYGTTQVSPPGCDDPPLVETFLSAFTQECRLTAADVEAIPIFRNVTLAIYAKFMATQRAAGRLDVGLEDFLYRSLADLR